MKTNTKHLMHPVLTTILEIKIFFTILAVIFGVVKVFKNLDAAMMADWIEFFLAVVAVYGAWLILHAQKLGFYLVVIPNLITGVMSLLYLPYMAKANLVSFHTLSAPYHSLIPTVSLRFQTVRQIYPLQFF